MPNDNVMQVPKRTLILFFICDTSGSMSGTKIETVNTSMRDVLMEFPSLARENNDAALKLAVLDFNSDATRVSTPQPFETAQWCDLSAYGCTEMGRMCSELNQKLTTTEFMSDATGHYAPVFFLLSDGEPTDPDEFPKELDNLKKNKFFHHGIRVALAIGDDADISMLEVFTGTRELVFTVYNAEQLRKLVKFVSVSLKLFYSSAEK